MELEVLLRQAACVALMDYHHCREWATEQGFESLLQRKNLSLQLHFLGSRPRLA